MFSYDQQTGAIPKDMMTAAGTRTPHTERACSLKEMEPGWQGLPSGFLHDETLGGAGATKDRFPEKLTALDENEFAK